MTERLTAAEFQRRFGSNKSLPFVARLDLQNTDYANGNNAHLGLQNPKPQRHHAKALGQAKEREVGGVGCVCLRYTGYRVKPLDPDNFAASTKNCTDFLQRSGLIDGDDPWKITLEIAQVKVRHYHEEKTVITLIYP